MTDNVAILDGFTREITLSNGAEELFLLIRPDTDLDSCFRAWDTDNQEYIKLYGWLYVDTTFWECECGRLNEPTDSNCNWCGRDKP